MTRHRSRQRERVPKVRVFTLEREQLLPFAREDVFDFFSNALNLERITPPFLRFRVTTPQPIVLSEGAEIRYRLRLHGFPFGWTTRIDAWDPPFRFVDRQLRGPYRLWEHTHTFEERPDGTLASDRVRYAVWGGALIDRLFVRSDVDKIFDYRAERLLTEIPRAIRSS